MTKQDLYMWQKIIIGFIENYNDYMDNDEILTLNSYDANKTASIRIQLPRRSGHTYLTSYIAKHYSTAIIYTDLGHWNEIQSFSEDEFHENTQPVSIYEISHKLNMSLQNKGFSLEREKNILSSKQVIIIDRASEVLDKFSQVEHYLYTVCQGQIIFLG